MSPVHDALSCRWSMPTLFLPAPYWLDAEDAPWTCVRLSTPRPLLTTGECAACPRWQARAPVAAGCVSASSPPLTDWLNAAPMPHETQDGDG